MITLDLRRAGWLARPGRRTSGIPFERDAPRDEFSARFAAN